MANNEYEAIAEQMGKSTPSAVNQFNKAAAELRDNKVQATQASVYTGASSNPEQEAKILDLSNKTNLPTEVVRRNFDSVSKKNTVESVDYEKLFKNQPNTSTWLEQSDNARIAHDDIDNLKGVEDSVNDYSLMKDLAKSGVAGLASFAASTARVPALLYNTEETINSSISALAGNPSEAQNAPDWLLNNPVATYFDDVAKKNQNESLAIPVVDALKQGDIGRATKGLLAQVVQGAPQTLGIVMAAAAGYGLPAIVATGFTGAAQSLKESENSNISPEAKTIGAVAKGTIQATAEHFGTLGIFKHWGSAMTEAFGTGITKEIWMGVGKTIAHSALGGFNQQAIASFAQDFTDYMTGENPEAFKGSIDKAVTAGLVGGVTGALITGGGAILQGRANSQGIAIERGHPDEAGSSAVLGRDAYIQLNQSYDKTKLSTRSQDAAKSFVEQTTKDTQMESIYIPVKEFQTFFQKDGQIPAQKAHELNATKSFDEALQTGGDVKIATSEWLSTASKEERVAIQDHVKFEPGTHTVNEALVEREAIQAALSGEDKAASEKVKTEYQQVREVVDTYKKQIKEAGLNPQYAELLRGVGTNAINEGLNPIEEMKKFNLQFEKGTSIDVGDNVLNQDYLPLRSLKKQVDFIEKTLKNSGLNINSYEANTGTHYITAKNENGESIKIRVSNHDPNVFREEQFGAADIHVGPAGYNSEYKAAESALKKFGLDIPDKLSNNILKEQKEAETYSDNLKKQKQDFFKKEIEEQKKALEIFKNIDNKTSLIKEIDNLMRKSSKKRSSYANKIYENFGIDKDIVSGKNTWKDIRDVLLGDKSINEIVDLKKSFYSLYDQENNGAPRGQILIGENAVKIKILENADTSTFIHEVGHAYLDYISKLASREGATDKIKNDLKTLHNWFGIEEGRKWEDLSKKEQIKAHEQFARGFEKFIGEGVAPSDAIKKVFNKFKYFIIKTYGNLTNLNVNLTPEVRDVMGRMLVTEAEISKAHEEMQYGPLFGAPAQVGMNEAQALRYREAQSEAQDSAREKLMGDLLKEAKKKQSVEYKAEREDTQKQIEKQVDNSTVYKTIDFLKENNQEIKFARDQVNEKFAKKLPLEMFSENGMNPDVINETLGSPFTSGQELVESLANAPKREDIVKQKTDAAMEARFPELVNKPEISDAAIDAVHNDKRAQVLRLELEHLASNNLPVLKDVVRKLTSKSVPDLKVVREQATKIINGKNTEELKPYIYRREEAKAAKEAGILFAKGDIDGAFEAKKRELLNNQLYGQAKIAADFVDSSLEKFKTILKAPNEETSKTRDMDIVNAARSVLAMFGLAGKTVKSPEQYLEQLKKYSLDKDTYNAAKNLVDVASQGAGPYKQTRFDVFSEMATSVNSLWNLSRESKQILKDGKAIAVETVVNSLSNRISEIQPNPKEGIGISKDITDMENLNVKLLGAKASMIRVEHWAYAMGGEFRKYITDPIQEATAKYRNEKEAVYKKYDDILKEHVKDFTRDPIRVPELGYEFKNKTTVLMALLHSGNDSNLSKLLRGRVDSNGIPWGTVNEAGTLDKSRWEAAKTSLIRDGVLTKSDFDFAQKIWNLMDSLKPEAQRAHKKMYGYYFNEITANSIQTPWGEYAGGYIPAKAELYGNDKASARAEKQAFEENNASFSFPTTGRGATKNRVDAYAVPLSLDMSLLKGHIDWAMRFSHIEPAVKDVAKIVMNEDFKKSMNTIDSSKVKEMLIPWLKTAASQKVVLPPDSMLGRMTDGFFGYMRKAVAMQVMMGSVKNIGEQATGIFVASSQVAPSKLVGSFADYIRGPKELSSYVIEKSEFMKSIQHSSIHEIENSINDIITDPSVWKTARNLSSKHAYFLQQALQNVINPIVWSAAFNEAIEKNKSNPKFGEKEAIREADSIIRRTQHTDRPEDIARFEVGTNFKRLFTQFTSHYNRIANLNSSEMQRISREVGLKNGAGKMFYAYLTTLAVPAILAHAWGKMLTKGIKDDDESVTWAAIETLIGSQATTVAAAFPGGGAVASLAISKLEKKMKGKSSFYNDELKISPVVSAIESATDVPAEVYDLIMGNMKNSRKTTHDVMNLLGYSFSLPIGVLAKPTNYLQDYASGKARPTGPIDFTRGLVTGNPGKK